VSKVRPGSRVPGRAFPVQAFMHRAGVSSARPGPARAFAAGRLAAWIGAAMLALSWGASAETVRIGMISTYSGPNAVFGRQMDMGVKLYQRLHRDRLPAGVSVEIVVRDDGGADPGRATQIARELLVNERVQLLTGLVWTPNALAIAPIVTEAKVPLVIMNAGGSVLTTRSPFIVRVSFTEWQGSYTIGRWAARRHRSAWSLVDDFGPGHDNEQGFIQGFSDGGGRILGSVRASLQDPDFERLLQKVRDEHPEVLFAYLHSGAASAGLMKAFSALGLNRAGTRLVGTGNIVWEEDLPEMGDLALGVVTAYHYSPTAERPANRAFIEAFAREYGADAVPTLMAVSAWDAMDAIYMAVRLQNGRIDPERTIDILRRYRSADSPRGPLAIDPETRDVVHDEYIREVRRVDGRLVNVEFETVSGVRDPWKERRSAH